MPWLDCAQNQSRLTLPFRMLRIAGCIGLGIGAFKTGTSTDPVDGVLVMICAAAGLLFVDAGARWYADWMVRQMLKPQVGASTPMRVLDSDMLHAHHRAPGGSPTQQAQSGTSPAQLHSLQPRPTAPAASSGQRMPARHLDDREVA
jgi:hypothetical protein